MLPSPESIGPTLLGASEYVTLYLIITLSGPIGLGTLVVKDASVDCVPIHKNSHGIMTMHKNVTTEQKWSYVNNLCASHSKIDVKYIGCMFALYLTIFFIGTSMVPRACLDQVLKEFNAIDSEPASRIVAVMKTLTRREIRLNHNTDKRVVEIARHIYNRADANYSFLRIKTTLTWLSFTLSILAAIISSLVLLNRDHHKMNPRNPFVCNLGFHDLPPWSMDFVCSVRGYYFFAIIELIQLTLPVLVIVHTVIQLVQYALSCRFLCADCCRSKEGEISYWAVEEAKWLFRRRFGYDFKPVQLLHESLTTVC